VVIRIQAGGDQISSWQNTDNEAIVSDV
jgi:hypothetical protein